MTREELEWGRKETDDKGVTRIYDYKHSYCKQTDCCERCDKQVRFWCKVIVKIERLQKRRILKICKSEVTNES